MALENRQSQIAKRMDRVIGIPLILIFAVLRPLLRILYRRRPGKQLRVLLIKLSALGDAVVMLPALLLLSRNLGDAEYVFLGGRSNQDFLNKLPFIKDFKIFSLATLRSLAGQSFDMVIDFDQWVRATALTSNLVRSPLTLGFRSPKQGRHFAFDTKVDFNLNTHMGENFWNLSKKALLSQGISVPSTFDEGVKASRPYFHVLISSRSPYEGVVVIHPGCGDHGEPREWPLDSWKELIQKLKAQNPSRVILVTGAGNTEVEMARKLEEVGAQSVAGKLTFGDFCQVLYKAKEIYCGNTGVMHLASLLNDGLLAIHGPTNIKMWGPLWGGLSIVSPVACAPCLTWGHDYGCSDPVCMKIISAKQVYKARHAEATSPLF